MTLRTLTAAVSREASGHLALEELAMAAPRGDDVLVEVSHSGICHTDINCHRGSAPTPKPAVLGHEGAGTVVEVGEEVDTVAPGDRVLMTFMSCRRCPTCQAGRPAYCDRALELNFMAAREDGSSAYRGSDVRSHFFGQSSFATLAMASARNVVRVPDGTPLEQAALFGCGVMTGAGTVLNVLQVRPGSSVAVFGAGAVGLSALIAARLAGASTVVAVDAVPSRLELARRLGASHTVLAGSDPVPEVVADAVGGGPDASVEASGNPRALEQAVDCLASGGTCAAVGSVGDAASPSWRALRLKGATIRGVIEGDAHPALFLPRLLRLHAEGRFPVDEMMQPYPFTKINEAIADAESGAVVKPVLTMAPEPIDDHTSDPR